VQLSSRKYVYIGSSIYEFTVPPGEKIIKYYSRVGNNDVPYPVAIGEKYVYFMLDGDYVPRSYFPNTLTKEQWDNLYSVYYGHEVWDGIIDPAKWDRKTMINKKNRVENLW
jgi:hypothetical protein